MAEPSATSDPSENVRLDAPYSAFFPMLTQVRVDWTSAGIVLTAVMIFLPAQGPAEQQGAPRLVAAWSAGPLEVRLGFDRPVDPSLAAAFVGKAFRIERLEARARQPRPDALATEPDLGTVRIAAARALDGARTVQLMTDPYTRAARYSLEAPKGIMIPPRPENLASAPLEPRRLVLYELSGVHVSWAGAEADAEQSWSGWLPSLDLAESRTMTAGSVEHGHGFSHLAKSGRLTISTLLILPKGRGTLRIFSDTTPQATLGGEDFEADGAHSTKFNFDSVGDPMDLMLSLPTPIGTSPASLRVTYQGAGDPIEHRLASSRLLLPWATALPESSQAPAPAPYPLEGGDPRRGEAVFFSEQAKCATCHQVRGKGGKVGPELDRRREKTLPEDYRDIADPGALIHPDFVPYTVAVKDGRVIVGIVRAEGMETIQVTDTDAKPTILRRDQIEELRPSSTSIMPVGLAGAIGEEKVRDLLAFLRQSATDQGRSRTP